jgi:bifunctional non-homologous end joining protein LigD
MKTAARSSVHLSHPDKVMYPAARFTKRDVAAYYTAIAPILLPHLHGRPITLKRYPNGVDGPFFYERRCPAHKPAFVQTANVRSTTFAEGIHHCVVNDLDTLLWVVNLASLEMHILLSTQAHVERPTQIMFDLDPGAPAGLLECAEIARELKKIFDSLKLQSFIKTSGGKGLHFIVPLNTPVTYQDTKPFAHSVAMLMERKWPRLVVSKMDKSLRQGKVLVDWSQNDNHKTTVAPYSLRAQPRPTVSTPLTWKEVEILYARKKAAGFKFETADVVARVKRHGDILAPILKLKQRVPRFASQKAVAA